MSAVAGIFAKETGYGFAFTASQNPAASLAAATAPPEPDIEAALDSDLKQAGEAPKRGKSKSRAPHLQVIK
jgi:stringent starvation protein B